MKKKIKRFVALVLAAVMSVQIFAGCSSRKSNSDTNEYPTPIKAVSVVFNESGEYKTTITSSEIDLSDLKTEDVSITYDFIDEDAYNEAVDKAKKDAQEEAEKKQEELLAGIEAKAESNPHDMSETDPEAESKNADEAATEDLGCDGVAEPDISIGDYFEEKEVEVTSVTSDKDKLELSFTDPDASKNLTCYYYIYLKGKKYENEDIVVDLNVEFNCCKLTPNIESVLSNSEETRLTLQLSDGSFADNVTVDDITLSGSFENMKIESLSCSGKKLTMHLVGMPVKSYGLTTFVDGVVSLRPQVVKDAGSEIKVYIPIEPVRKYLDASTIKSSGDKVTAEVELIDTSIPLDELKPEDFKFEKDVTVTDVKKTCDSRVELTMNVKGATDANSAAAVLNGQTLKVTEEEEISVLACQAYFYPVFDKIEKSGDDLKFTIIAYANSGTFSESLKTDQIVLGEGFEKGKVESVERQSGSSAKIVFTVPANGQTAESFSIDGKITIKSGALVSKWGEPTPEDCSNTRNYSQESIERNGGNFAYVFEGLCEAGRMRINETFNDIYNWFCRDIAKGSESLQKQIYSAIDEIRRSIQNALLDVAHANQAAIDAVVKETLPSRVIAWAKTAIGHLVSTTIMNSTALCFMVYDFCADIGCGENRKMIDVLEKTKERTEKLREEVQKKYFGLR